MLEAIKEENAYRELRFLTISKNENSKHLETIFESIKQSKNGKSIGVLAKEKMQGNFGSLWEDALAKSGLTLVDVAPGFSDLLSVKDALEVVWQMSKSALTLPCSLVKRNSSSKRPKLLRR
jgi:nucleosome binding factor SPN SPT16 subunit